MALDAYAKAGVDISKIKRLQEFMSGVFGATFDYRLGKLGRPILPIGHYAGIIDLGGDQALAIHADGVGTKVLVAQMMRKYDTVGIDCVAMNVNDLLCMGSEPMAMVDYLALEREDDQLVKEVANGLAEGARRASIAIAGGETAVLGEIIKGVGGRGFDLAGVGVGLVRKNKIVDGSRIMEGDRIVGIRSSGLHSNGFTLARKVLKVEKNLRKAVPGLGKVLGDELLTPTAIYVNPVLEIVKKADVHGLAHITGGAFSKLKRLVKERPLSFKLDPFPSLPIFELIKKQGKLSDKEMYSTFNMGVGFCIVAPPGELGQILRICGRHRVEAFEMGKITGGEGVFVGRIRAA